MNYLPEIVSNTVDNTFVGTLLAGIFIAVFGLKLYRKQKQIDVRITETKAVRNTAMSLFGSMEIADKHMKGLSGMYDTKNERLAQLIKLSDKSAYDSLVQKYSRDLDEIFKETEKKAEELFSKLKIKNEKGVDLDLMKNELVVIQLLLQSSALVFKTMSQDEILDWMNNWNETKSKISNEVMKILD